MAIGGVIGGLGLGGMAGIGAGAGAALGNNVIGGGFGRRLNTPNKLDITNGYGWANQLINGLDQYNFFKRKNTDLSEGNQTSETSQTSEEEEKKNDLYAYMEEQKRQQWEREDRIRRETQAREDNAWERAVADMQRAGVNPNLVNAQPAESGGGITNATGNDYSGLQAELSAEIQKYSAELSEETADKDRTADILSRLATAAAMIGISYFSKGKLKTK